MFTQEFVTTSGQRFPRIEYLGQPVCTVKMIAAEHNSGNAKTSANAFSYRQAMFVEGEDYFSLSVSKNNPSHLMHALALGTTRARVFTRAGYEKLCPFMKKQPSPAFLEYFSSPLAGAQAPVFEPTPPVPTKQPTAPDNSQEPQAALTETVTINGIIMYKKSLQGEPLLSLATMSEIIGSYPSMGVNTFTRYKYLLTLGVDYFLLSRGGVPVTEYKQQPLVVLTKIGYTKLIPCFPKSVKRDSHQQVLEQYFLQAKDAPLPVDAAPVPLARPLPSAPKAPTKKAKDDSQSGILTTRDYKGFPVRSILQDGEVWFVGKDITTILGYSNPTETVRLYCPNRRLEDIPTPRGIQAVTVIPEKDALYLFIRASSPAKEKFSRWFAIKTSLTSRSAKQTIYIKNLRAKETEGTAANFMIVAGVSLPVLEYKNQRVLSPSAIDKIHGLFRGSAHGFLTRNEKKFSINKDYVSPGHKADVQGSAYHHSTLYTVTGYMKLTKLLKEKAPLKMRQEVVNKYFNMDYSGTYTHKPAKAVEAEVVPVDAVPVEAIAVEPQQAAPAVFPSDAIVEPVNIPMLFNFDNQDVRTFVRDGETWFMASDVCNVLGYANSRDAISRHCRGVAKHDTPTTSGIQEVSIIPERDLYRLVMKSKLPSAERFENWVVSEVLPSIRKSGSFSAIATTPATPQIALDDPFAVRDFMIGYCGKLAEKDAVIAEKDTLIAELQSKAAMMSDQIQSFVDSFSKERH